jgi:4-diphosphocytidyl-2-C-methyl-D-erythritol kinase
LISYPNCKINLGLHILRKRSDGYHDLETVFYPLPFPDILEIIPDTTKKDVIHFQSSGINLNSPAGDNLCIKAYQLLKKDFPQIPPIQMHLHKQIPTGAGLGGGSADAAFTIKMLNEIAGLGLSHSAMMDYAAQLGSDCPFFILNQPCYATGRGELLEPIAVDLSGFDIVLINPGIHVNTRVAFEGIQPVQPAYSLKEQILKPVEEWKHFLQNDFEKTVFKQYPEIPEIKNTLYGYKALYAAMTGSGSSVFGIFTKGSLPELSLPAHYFVKKMQALAR